jgi:hypothetical protein
MQADDPNEPVETESAPSKVPERSCVACGEPISELVATRPEYCFVCAVHAVCACADETE